jgi:hypothetical protein
VTPVASLLWDMWGRKLGARREMVATKVEAAMAAARRAPDGKLVQTAARRPVGRSLGFMPACGKR